MTYTLFFPQTLLIILSTPSVQSIFLDIHSKTPSVCRCISGDITLIFNKPLVAT